MALGIICLTVSNTSLLVGPAGVATDHLVTLYLRSLGKNIDHISYLDYQYYRENNHVFTDMAALPEEVGVIRVGFGAPGQSQKSLVTVTDNSVSDNYFSVLGLNPYLGRFFAASDHKSGSGVAVMTYSCWRRLGSDPHIVGKVVGPLSIIGVAPKEFTGSLFGINGDLLVPLSSNTLSSKREDRRLNLLARLKPGVSRVQAQADISVLSHQLAAAYPKEDRDCAAIVTRASLLPPDAMPTAKLAIATLLIIVLMVLLIACANVANLLLALAIRRRQEATIKLSLGASRWRVIREFLREASIICAISSVLGYGIAAFVITRYSNFNIDVPMLGSYFFGLRLDLDFTVAAFTAVLMSVAILATGLPAALYASSPNLAQILSGEMVVGGKGKKMRMNALVVIQVAVCTLVLFGMGLCERSLYSLRHVNPGFETQSIIAMDIADSREDLNEAQRTALSQKARETVSTLPGVESATVGSLPLLSNENNIPVRLPGADKAVSVRWAICDEHYFTTFDIQVLAGRGFDPEDTASSPAVVVINKKMAEALWPGRDAVGRTLLIGDTQTQAVVVGVAANVRFGDLYEEPSPLLYYAQSQRPETSLLIVRTKGNPLLWTHSLVEGLRHAGIESPLDPMTFQNVENISLLPERIVAGCVTGLGALGMLLAAVGLFGAISYSVSARKKELGLRIALGAQPLQLLKMIFRETLSVAGTGTMIGIAFGVAVTVVARSHFYRIGVIEWSVLIPVGATMLAVSLAIAYVSARPWLRVEPMEAVRHA
jgi:predicted permease